MGTHPTFESDFDCLTEWQVIWRLMHPQHARRNALKLKNGTLLPCGRGILLSIIVPFAVITLWICALSVKPNSHHQPRTIAPLHGASAIMLFIFIASHAG